MLGRLSRIREAILSLSSTSPHARVNKALLSLPKEISTTNGYQYVTLSMLLRRVLQSPTFDRVSAEIAHFRWLWEDCTVFVIMFFLKIIIWKCSFICVPVLFIVRNEMYASHFWKGCNSYLALGNLARDKIILIFSWYITLRVCINIVHVSICK